MENAKDITSHPYTKGPVIIGNDVWIGEGSLILSGVSVGDGAIIAAHSVVVNDVPPYALVAGNPAQIKRMRFSAKVISELEEIKWWDYDDEAINLIIPYLMNPDIETSLEKIKEILSEYTNRKNEENSQETQENKEE